VNRVEKLIEIFKHCGRAVAGISGGRTSAMMAHMLGPDVVLCNMNTGKENEKTLEYLCRLEDDLGREIVRLEWRAPARGLPPRFATFERVSHATMSRKGEPFTDLLLCLKAYRAKEKNAPPVAPWARQRICTSYLKIKTQRMFCHSLGWGDDYTQYVGLRADEPSRVAKMRERNEQRDTDERAPLFDLGIVKKDVLSYWGSKPYDLEIPEYLGNCTGCFLKDEADLATAMVDPATDPLWWIAIENDFAPMRRGGRPSYAQVYAEAPDRLAIREALLRGEVLPETSLPAKRRKLIVKQEQERLASGSQAFSCGCEGAEKMTDEDLLNAIDEGAL
jgi:3'-phosphoadenosine 5'-phosphosulfate sulfotransferase (PAPS reductase)/FAD synthetase